MFFLATSQRQQILTVINNSFSPDSSKMMIISMKHHQLADSTYNNINKYSAIQKKSKDHHSEPKDKSLQDRLDKKLQNIVFPAQFMEKSSAAS